MQFIKNMIYFNKLIDFISIVKREKVVDNYDNRSNDNDFKSRIFFANLQRLIVDKRIF